MEVFDISLNSDKTDISLILTFSESTESNQLNNLKENEGMFRDAPLLGVGLDDFLNDENPSFVSNRIRRKMELDGQEVQKLDVEFTTLNELNINYVGVYSS